MKHPIDRVFLFLTITLLAIGFLGFLSAGLGIYSRPDGDSKFFHMLLTQVVLGLAGGGVAMWWASRTPSLFWRSHALVIYGLSIVLMCLVFVPGIGLEHGGAKRWVDLRFFTFQPSEFLKFGLLVYTAAWFSFVKKKATKAAFGLFPLLGLVGITGALLFLQHDNDTIFFAAIPAVAIFFSAGGGKWKDVLALGAIALVLLGGIIATQEHVRVRVMNMFGGGDAQSSGYQMKQSLIAVATGGWTGRGLGQSVQKFHYLPEPAGDTVFAVFAEEWGFAGSLVLLLLYAGFTLRGLQIASRATDRFGGLLAGGLVILIAIQSFFHIGSSIGVLPTTGIPLAFMSQGGTSLLLTMFETGVVMSVSRTRHT